MPFEHSSANWRITYSNCMARLKDLLRRSPSDLHLLYNNEKSFPIFIRDTTSVDT
jgi:hypothetical protein